MARTIQRLSARSVSTLAKPGRHADGNGLYLVVDKNGAKRWVFMSWARGRQVEAGLGGLSSVSLAMARERAQECRRLVAEGRSPTEARNGLSSPISSYADPTPVGRSTQIVVVSRNVTARP